MGAHIVLGPSFLKCGLFRKVEFSDRKEREERKQRKAAPTLETIG
jgi:hypothetical protein